jgi:hypothetical protein
VSSTVLASVLADRWPAGEAPPVLVPESLDSTLAGTAAATIAFPETEGPARALARAVDHAWVVLVPPASTAMTPVAARIEVATTEALVARADRGGRTAVLDAAALAPDHREALSVRSVGIRRNGERLRGRLAAAERLVLDCPGGVFPLPGDVAWEVETTDPAREPLFQLPGGEVFAHFDCRWDGAIDVAAPSGGLWTTWTLELRGGTVARILNALGRTVSSALAGRRVTEIGIGTNPGVSDAPVAWGEKRAGTVHLGLGPRIQHDAAPRSVHSDVLVLAGAVREA